MRFRVIIGFLFILVIGGSPGLSQDVPVNIFDYHVGRVNSLAISHDKRYIASGSDDKTVNVVEISSGNIVSKFKFPSKVQQVDFSYDDQYVAGASVNLILITNLETKESREIEIFSGIEQLKFNTVSSSEIFVVADIENQTGTFVEGLFSLDMEKSLTTKYCDANTIRDFCIVPDGTCLYTAISNKILKIDLKLDSIIQEYTASTTIYSVDLYPDNKGLISCTQNGAIYWSLETGKSVPYYSTTTDPYLVKAGLNNNYFIVADRNMLRLREHYVTNEDIIVTGVSAINDFVISPDSKFLITADESSVVKVWENPYYDESLASRGTTAESDKTAMEISSKKDITDEFILEQYESEIETDLKLRSELFAPKDEFEKTTEYEARLAEADKYKESIIEFYKDKHWEQIRFQMEQDSILRARKAVLLQDKIRDSYKEIRFFIDSVGMYDADEEILPVYLKGARNIVKIPVDEAKSFKLNFNKAIVYGVEQLRDDGITLDTFNMLVVHPLTNNSYPIGRQDDFDEYFFANSQLMPDDQIDTMEIETVLVEKRIGKKLVEHNLYEEEFIRALSDRNYYGLFIGINDYMDEQINDLEYPIQDAKDMYTILNKKYGFKDDNSIILENPSRAEIINTFDDLAMRVNNTDQLLIFYAGHGKWDEKLEQGYWLPRDAQKDSKAQWLSNGTIRDYIRGINSKHTLLIADACFSGGIFKTRDLFNTSSKAALELYKLPSRKAITSGTMNTVPDKSVFMKYLLKRLDSNKSKIITSSNLFAAFREAVINNSSVGQVPQYGEIREAGDEGGDFVFLKD